MPDSRSPPVKVVVFQWPWGMAARHRSPQGARPRSRAIFVDAAVSSMKISLSGSIELAVEPGYAAAQDIGALLL